MSHVIFIKCTTEGCESNPYPVEVGMEDTLSKCVVCDPKSHATANLAEEEKKRIINNPEGLKKVDPHRVISLEEGGFVLDDGPNIEVDATPEKYVPQDDGIKIPTLLFFFIGLNLNFSLNIIING